MTPMQPQIPLTQRTWFIVVWVIFFFPVGIVFLWLHPRWTRTTKIVGSAIMPVLFLMNAIYSLSPDGKADAAQQAKEQAQIDTQVKRTEADQAKRNALAAIPEPVRRFPALTEFPAVVKIVDDQTNDEPPKPKLRDFQYIPETHHVNIDINMDQNLTENLADEGVNKEVSDLYQAFYSNPKTPVNSVAVDVYGPLEDRYGHTTQDLVYGTKMAKDVADKVNWRAEESDLELSIVPKLWTVFENFQNKFSAPAAKRLLDSQPDVSKPVTRLPLPLRQLLYRKFGDAIQKAADDSYAKYPMPEVGSVSSKEWWRYDVVRQNYANKLTDRYTAAIRRSYGITSNEEDRIEQEGVSHEWYG